MSEVTNIPKLRFSVYQDNWTVTDLRNLSKIKGRIGFRGYTKSDLVSEGHGALVLGGKNILSNKLDLTDRTYLTWEKFHESPEIKLNKDDIILSQRGTLGDVAIINVELGSVTINPSMVVLKGIKIDPYFLFYQLCGETIQQTIKRITTSTAVPMISQKQIGEFQIKYPSLPEQKKIADFLTAVDKRIELLEKRKTHLETYKKGVMKKIFNQEIRFKDDSGKEFPDWEEKMLGDLFNFIRGSSLSKSDLNVDGEFKCIHYGELFTIYKEVIRTIVSNTNKEGTRSIHGDILMPTSDVTPFGLATASCIQEKDVILGGDMNILRSKSNIEPVFFSYLLNFNVGSIIKLVTGTTIKHIYSKDLKPLRFNVPTDKSEQKRIADFFCSIDIQIELFQTQIDKSKTWKKGLLQKMFV